MTPLMKTERCTCVGHGSWTLPSKNHDFPNMPFKRWTSKAELSDFISIFTGA